jgi:serine/threonine-protein kinase
VEKIVSGGKTKNIVKSTKPPAGQKLLYGSKVTVNVFAGPTITPIPSVVGETLSQAIIDLHNAGFNINPTYVDNNAPKDTIVGQDPAPTTPKPAGTIVNVQVSNGPPQTTVPNVVGLTLQQAITDLQADGFKVRHVQTPVSDPNQQNLVQSQTPLANTQAGTGSTVTIYVGRYVPPTTTTTTTQGQ